MFLSHPSLGSWLTWFSIYPIDTIKFRYQCEIVANGPRGSALLHKMAPSLTPSVLYRGATLALIGVFPYAALEMGTFEFAKRYFTNWNARLMGLLAEDSAGTTTSMLSEANRRRAA